MKLYNFEICGVARGAFFATPEGAKEFMSVVFNSKYEGFCCEVSEDEVQRICCEVSNDEVRGSGTDNDSE